MSTYLVECRGESREVYSVEANDAAEAEANWADGSLVVSESTSMEVYSVEKEEDL